MNAVERSVEIEQLRTALHRMQFREEVWLQLLRSSADRRLRLKYRERWWWSNCASRRLSDALGRLYAHPAKTPEVAARLDLPPGTIERYLQS